MATMTVAQQMTVEELGKDFSGIIMSGYVDTLLNRIRTSEFRSEQVEYIAKLKEVLKCIDVNVPDDLEHYGFDDIQKIVDDNSEKLIHTADDMEYEMLRVFLKRYQTFKSPEDYMKRIVDALENPEDGWTKNSLRLRILKRFIKYGDYLKSCGHNGEEVIKNYVALKCGKTRKTLTLDDVLSGLDDKIFDTYEANIGQKRKDLETQYMERNASRYETLLNELSSNKQNLMDHFVKFDLPQVPSLHEIREETDIEDTHKACLTYSTRSLSVLRLLDAGSEIPESKTKRAAIRIESLANKSGEEVLKKIIHAAIRVKYAQKVQECMNARVHHKMIEDETAERIRQHIVDDLGININIKGARELMNGADLVSVISESAYVTGANEYTEQQKAEILAYIETEKNYIAEKRAEFADAKISLCKIFETAFGCEISDESIDLLIQKKVPAKSVNAFYDGLTNIVYDCQKVSLFVKSLKNLQKFMKEKQEKIKDGLKNYKCTLIPCAKELTSGLFKTGGSTKQALYQFAIVYGMTFGIKDNGMNPRRDVERNLFEDYYSNNMMRFLNTEYKGHMADYDVDPLGTGINYKNYVEMIYLYHLHNDVTFDNPDCKDMNEAEKTIFKLKSVSEMIQEVKNSSRVRLYDAGNQSANQEMKTAVYRNNIRKMLSSQAFDLSPKAFTDHLLDSYYVKSTANVGDMMLGTHRRNAFANYQLLIDKLKEWEIEAEKKATQEEKESSDSTEAQNREPLASYTYGLAFADVAAYEKTTAIVDKLKKEFDHETVDKFLFLLKRVNGILGRTTSEHEVEKPEEKSGMRVGTVKKAIKALSVENSEALTRTSMLVAFYYYYNHRQERKDKNKTKTVLDVSFKEFFENFRKEADVALELSYYQPISTKSIFDMMLVFSSYAYLYL